MFCDRYSQASWRLRKLETEIWRSPVTTNSWLSPYPTLMKLASWIAPAAARPSRWVVSIVPQVIAWDRDARATRRTTPNTPRNRDARAHRLPNDSTATLPSWEGMDEDVIKAWSHRTDSLPRHSKVQ